MNHSNMYAVGLALCTFANIASEEMSRDLANEIEKLLGSSNTYIRKKVCPLIRDHSVGTHIIRKAALCALRVVKKVPDIADHFNNTLSATLNQKYTHTSIVSQPPITGIRSPNALERLHVFSGGRKTTLTLSVLKWLLSLAGEHHQQTLIFGHNNPYKTYSVL